MVVDRDGAGIRSRIWPHEISSYIRGTSGRRSFVRSSANRRQASQPCPSCGLPLNADLHFRISWSRWLIEHPPSYDLVWIAGDLLDMFTFESRMEQTREIRELAKVVHTFSIQLVGRSPTRPFVAPVARASTPAQSVSPASARAWNTQFYVFTRPHLVAKIRKIWVSLGTPIALYIWQTRKFSASTA
jgi:hypothetical protein